MLYRKQFNYSDMLIKVVKSTKINSERKNVLINYHCIKKHDIYEILLNTMLSFIIQTKFF